MKLLKYLGATVIVWALALVPVVVSGAGPARPNASVTITNPAGPVAFGEANEYATLAWNDPWDMSQPLDVRQLDSAQCSGVPNTFVEYSPCPGGIWCGLATSANPDLFLLFPGQNSLHHGRDGNLRPINASVYTQLTFRMYVEAVGPSEPGLQIYWTNGTIGDIGGDLSKYGGSHFYKVYQGWNIYTIDLSKETNPENGDLPWTGNLTGLRLDPALNSLNNRQVQLDWVRLSAPAPRTVAWTTTDTGSVSISLEHAGVVDRLHIYEYTGNLNTEVSIPASAGPGQYSVPASLPPGDWFVHLGVGSNPSSGPAGPWQVQAAPTLSFVAPSYTSGEDFAWAQMGEVWDMNEPSDIYAAHNLAAAPSFAGGELAGTSADTDPNNDCSPYWEDPFVNLLDDAYWGQAPDPVDPPIDTSRYRYLSFRLRLDGTPDVSFGWVARVVWSGLLFANCGVTDDIPLHAGWNTVYVDLWDAGTVEAGSGCPSAWRDQAQRRQLRLDPHEVPVSTTFHLDEVKLTAMDSAPAGGTYAVKYVRSAANAGVEFYYDTDRNPNNAGHTRMDPFTPPSVPPHGPWAVFLPGMFRNPYPAANPPGMQTFWWDLDGVAPGTYYVRAELNGAGQVPDTTWYSETPVVVSP